MTDTHKPGDKPKGWFSRRHATQAQHLDAVAKYKAKKALRLERSPLTPRQQLDALDARLGVGVGATKERARLQAQL